MKRIILLFSVLMLSCIALWAHDVEIDGIYYNLNETKKTAEVTYYGDDDYNNEYSGSVTIPETLTYNSQTYRVTSIGSSAFSRCSGLAEVTIPNSVTSIGNEAFYYCSGLTSVTIGNSVTYIDGGAFIGCSGLTKVNYLGTVDKWVEIYFGSNPTYYANDLYINNELVTDVKITSAGSIGHDAFTNCKSIKSVEICNSVTSIGSSAFSRCSGLTEVTIPNSVTSIGSMAFRGCSGLTEVTIPNSVTSIDYDAFYDCSGLTSVTIPNSVTHIGSGAFYNTGIYNNNSNWDNGVLYIDNCLINAKSDIVKGSYTIKEGTRFIADLAFYVCSELTSVTIPNSVTSIGNEAFYGCRGLTSVTIPNSVTSIGSSAFRGCRGLTSVTIGNSVTSIGPSAFYNTGIYNNNSNWDNGVLYIDNCLINAKSDVVKGSYTIKKGTRIIGYYAFYDCSGLTSITIPNSVTSIGSSAFFGCSGLTKVNYLGTVDKWVEIDFAPSFSNPTYYAKDLYINNELLTDVKITTVDSIKNFAFYNCQSIKSVEIGNSVTSIGVGAFIGCSGLTSVTIPNSITSIGNEAFYDCSGLTSVTIGNSVTSIGSMAFFGCSGLTSVTIGNSVTSIGQYAFSGCNNLIKVTAYPTTVPNAYENSFAHYNAYLYVPCDVYEDYDLDDVFGNFQYIKCIAGEEDEPTSITETLADANITVSGGTISAEANFSIYNTIGQNVTAFNGSLQPGIYLVSIENNIVKVMVH